MPKRHAPVKILIVDDHPLVREGLALRISLHSDLEVCGEADSEEQAMELVRQMQPDLVLVDISLRSGHGLELIKRIHSLAPTVKVLVISGFEESLYAERAFRAGALGYLNKQESNERMIEAIRAVLAGHRFVTPAMSRRLVEQVLGTSVNHRTPIEQLTNRELEIFHMIGQGIKTSDIAERLFLSTHTIDTHRENIKRKLTISSAAELTRAAVQWVLEHG